MIRVCIAFLLLIAAPVRAEVNIQEVTSPGGITAWLVEEESIPFTALEIAFRGGASLDQPGKRGATNLMTATLEEGYGDLDARAFAQAREELAASIRFDVGDDTLSVSARFLTDNRDAAIELVRGALNEPRFDEEALERVRGQVLSGLRSKATDPNALVADRFDKEAYGDHPYGSDLSGTIESVSALTRDDIVEAWKGVIARDRLYVAAVGDITPEELGEILDTILGDLPESGAPMPEEVAFDAEQEIILVPFDTPQSVAQFGHAGMENENPDFFAAYLLNTVMGGSGFESRLFDEVREKRGLTYGIGSFLSDKDHSNAYVGSFSSVNENMADAIDVVRAEWEKMAAEGITEEELRAAKLYLTGSYPLRWDGNARIAGILVGMQLSGYPIDYPKTRNDRVNAVTLEEANRVAKELFRPENLRFVVSGQPVGLDEAIQ